MSLLDALVQKDHLTENQRKIMRDNGVQRISLELLENPTKLDMDP